MDKPWSGSGPIYIALENKAVTTFVLQQQYTGRTPAHHIHWIHLMHQVHTVYTLDTHSTLDALDALDTLVYTLYTGFMLLA